MNAACQPNLNASHAINGAATMAPIVPPEEQMLFAVARSFGGNQIVTTRSWAGKVVGSAMPSAPRKKASWPKVLENPAPKQAADHPIIPKSITRPAPKRSTNQPAGA